MQQIIFRKETKTGRQYDPRKNFELTTIESEIRYDPLTGDTGRICHFSLSSTAPEDLEDMAAATAMNCPFCSGMVHDVTPRFPEEILREGRLVHGDAVLFPNLFPYDDLSAVAVISKNHFHSMEDMPTHVVEDGLGVARKFLEIAEPHISQDGSEVFGIVTWNYMPPSGSSQVHPHMQIVATTTPGNAIRREIAAGKTYYEEHGRTYMADLVEIERSTGLRWIGESGTVKWIAPFVPNGLMGDCMAVFPDRSTVLDLNDQDIVDFAIGFRRILKAFSTMGLWSFNLTFLPGAMGTNSDHHWLTAKITPRLFINPTLHVSDVAYLQLHLDERFAMISPEQTAEKLRNIME